MFSCVSNESELERFKAAMEAKIPDPELLDFIEDMRLVPLSFLVDETTRMVEDELVKTGRTSFVASKFTEVARAYVQTLPFTDIGAYSTTKKSFLKILSHWGVEEDVEIAEKILAQNPNGDLAVTDVTMERLQVTSMAVGSKLAVFALAMRVREFLTRLQTIALVMPC